jgi:predicted peroxiredoxin
MTHSNWRQAGLKRSSPYAKYGSNQAMADNKYASIFVNGMFSLHYTRAKVPEREAAWHKVFEPPRTTRTKGYLMEFIISGSHGTDDPTMATLPFMAAKAAQEQGHDVILFLWNEAVTLARPGIGDHITGVNLPPLKDTLVAIQTAGIPIWVCGACAVARKIGAPDLVSGALIKTMGDYIKAVAERDKCVAFWCFFLMLYANRQRNSSWQN